MPFDMYGDAILTRDVTEHGLRAGDVGTVVERHAIPGIPDGYSVEFFDMTGNTAAVATLPASALPCRHQPTGLPCELSAPEPPNRPTQLCSPSVVPIAIHRVGGTP